MNNSPPLLELQNVSVEYFVNRKKLTALHNVNLTCKKKETIAHVGESGSGKSTLGKALLRLEAISSGKVLINGVDIHKLSSKEMRAHRKEMQMIFQDPASSLNPRMTVEQHLTEALLCHNLYSNSHQIDELLEMVKLRQELKTRYAFQLSGGQKQRVAIARALSLKPNLIVLDEPLSALDMSVRAQIITLLQELQKELSYGSLFITHDLTTLAYLAEKVAVLYLGHIVECAPVEKFYQNPLHPYSKILFQSTLDFATENAPLELKGELPSPFSPMNGCPFYTRCPFATERCKKENPVLTEVSKNHFVACHLVQ